MDYTQGIKNTKAYKNIKFDVESQRLAHAFLFVNEDEDYLLEFAKNVCALIFGDEKLTPRIKNETFPDVIFVGRNSKITSADASFITTDVYVKGYESDKKIYVLIDVDEMNSESQNKILKTLEEPPQNVYLLLLARNTASILPTIMSRVSVVELEHMPNSEIVNMLTSNGIAKDLAEEVVPCAGGNAKLAYKMAGDKNFSALYENTASMFENMNSSRDIIGFAKIFGEKTVDKKEWLNIIELFARDVLMIKSGNLSLVLNKKIMERLKRVSAAFSVGALVKIIQTCLHCKESLLYNVNSSCIVDELLLKFVEAKVTCKK